MPATTLPVGTIVRYRGRLEEHHGLYMVAGEQCGRYILQEYDPMYPDWPTHTLRQVDPRHVTPIRHKPGIHRHHDGPGAAGCTYPQPEKCTARTHLTYTAECECGWVAAHNVRRRVEEAREKHLEEVHNAATVTNQEGT